MCGIAGFIGKNKNWENEIHRMCQRMAHRGPDMEGVWSEDGTQVVLGHRRLSILDLTDDGIQPMLSEDKRYVISYNGEIYNFQTIANELCDIKGKIVFKSKTDTEVLLQAVSKWGIKKTLQKCRGMFALALYDRKEDILYLSRDRIGEKPLYYGKVSNKFVFASEIACLEQMTDFKNNICMEALSIYFQYGYVPAPYSIYEGIYKLEAGTILKVTGKGEELERDCYWSIQDVAINGQKNIFKGTEEEATEELKKLLKETIRLQMLADVPVGAFLSAGIDSSTIVSLMQEISERPIKTFTIGIENQQYNEAIIAKEISKILGTNHTEWYISEKEAQEVIPQLSYYYSEPFADSSQIPTMLVSKLAKQQVTVSLSGDGGDELFAGYFYYGFVEKIWKQINQYPGILRKSVRWAFNNIPQIGECKFAKRGEFLKCANPEEVYNWARKTDFNKKIFSKEILAYSKNDLCNSWIFQELQQNIMLMDLQMYHPDDILTKVDRAAMAYSLETRIPLLDTKVVEFAWSLPFEYKKQGEITKKVLRNILYQYIPKEVVNRPKTGFSIPLEKWLRDKELNKWAGDLIDFGSREERIFNSNVIRKMWNEYCDKGKWNNTIWYFLMFMEWRIKNV